MTTSKPPVTTNTANHTYLTSVYASTSPSESRTLYDSWASSYDADMASSAFDYLSPEICSRKVLQHTNTSPGAAEQPSTDAKLPTDLKILDAGCGTGLVGLQLQKMGASNIDGVDLSPGMLDHARQTGAYTSLSEMDLSQPMTSVEDGTYDVLICCGTLTHGHVGPFPALGEFCRVVKRRGVGGVGADESKGGDEKKAGAGGGLVVATVLGDIWESGGYREEVERLEREGVCEVLEKGVEEYRRGASVKAVVVVLRVL